MRAYFVTLLYGIGVFLSLKSIEYACSFFIWSEIFRPLAFAYRWDLFPAAHVVAITLLVAILWRPWQRRWNVSCTVMSILVGWTFIAAFLSRFKPVAMEAAVNSTKYMIPLILISMSLVRRKGQNLYIWTMAAAVGVWSAQAGIHCLIRGKPDITMGIPGGQMSDRNDFMVGVVAAIPLIAYTGWAYNWFYPRIVRLGFKLCFLLSIAAVVFSLSRGAIVGLSGLVLYYVVATGRFTKRFAIIGLLAAMGIQVLPSFVSDRMGTIELSAEYQTEGSAANRLMYLKKGTEMALDYPIAGVGPSNFGYVLSSYYVPGHYAEPHNIWIKCATEYGLPILVLFIFLVWHLLRGLGNARKAARARGDHETELLATALACGLVGFLATATFTSQFMSEYFWSIVGVSGAFLATPIVERKDAEQDGDSATGAEKPEPATV